MAEYANMRGGYMSEYQINYDHNSSRRDDRIIEMNMAIEAQVDYAKDLARTMEQQQSCLTGFFTQKSNLFAQRTVWKAWRFYFSIYKRKSRLAAYTRNTLHRQKVKRLFTAWKNVSSSEFKARLAVEKRTFRTELESKILVQWSTKVDALLLYVAELEEKIKQEQEAREKLTLIYEASLLHGQTALTRETQVLQQNPLVHEVNCRGCEVPEPRVTIEQRRQAIFERMTSELQQRKLSEVSQGSERQDGGDLFNRMSVHFRAQMQAADQV